jgi:hypothetical protein
MTFVFQLPKKFFGHKQIEIYANSTQEAETLCLQNTGMQGKLTKIK